MGMVKVYAKALTFAADRGSGQVLLSSTRSKTALQVLVRSSQHRWVLALDLSSMCLN